MPPGLFLLFSVASFILGACIGSFLNVCIYRMPRDMSVNQPKRSFCPNCKYQIPWWNNLPLISWLALRGKCANCKKPIPFRYFGVEFLTAILFLTAWLRVCPDEMALAIPYFVFLSLLVVATFVDFEFFIIPDEVTWGGAAAGILISFIIPSLHGVEGDQFAAVEGTLGVVKSHLAGGLYAIIGTSAGFALLWLVAQGGKLVFGKTRKSFTKPEQMSWVRRNDEADLQVGEDKRLWSEIFGSESERIRMECEWLEVDGERQEKVLASWTLNWLEAGGKKWQLEKIDQVSAWVSRVTYPRDAMGFGDVKFLACIGAFLGWKAIIFTVVFASIFGSIVGVSAILLRRKEWSAKIPFGPYLAAGALLWMLRGPELLEWYVARLNIDAL